MLGQGRELRAERRRETSKIWRIASAVFPTPRKRLDPTSPVATTTKALVFNLLLFLPARNIF
jgi:hypothetical protein